ncbi:Uncharacterised protein [Enterobacter cloacae]|nr:Uncharacterised protein [Enterobacter cloacae]
MDAAGIAQDLAIYPLMHFIGWDQSGVWLPVVGGDEVNWRVWPALVIVSHGLLRCLICLALGLQVIPGHVDQ